MKKLLVTAGMGLLLLGAAPLAAMAQEHRDEHSDRGDRGNRANRGPQGAGPQAGAPQATGNPQPLRNPQPGEPGFNRQNAPPPGVAVAPPGAMPPPLGGQGGGHADARPQDNRGNFNAQNNNNNGRYFNNNARNNNNFGGRDSRFNNRYRGQSGFAGMHRNFTAPGHFRAGRYVQPRGWYARRWSFGDFLPITFWARDYWLYDYQRYDLPPPPYGTVWVRVDEDALLIDQDTGEVIQVAYDVFY